MMHIPKQFQESRVDILQGFMRDYPLCTLITLSSAGVNANHIPMHVIDTPSPFGALTCHIDKSNRIVDDIHRNGEVLAIFNGPNTYITPSWMPTKKEKGRVVPTWNYAVVHARGNARVIEDKDWLYQQISAFTDHSETGVHSQWRMSDAPEEFTAKLMNGVLGLEIIITELSGKWKVSQNETLVNRNGITEGLRQGDNAAMATLVAAAMEG